MTEGRHPISPTPMRRAIARRMAESKATAPHFYLTTEVEMDALLAAVETRNAGRDRERRVTVTGYLLRAVALTLVEHPTFNAVWNGDVVEVVDAINIGVAIALDDGLIAPALLDCRDRDVDDLAAGLADLAARTRAGKLRAAEIAEGTFTLSNLGMFEVNQFTAIITPPQVAILATARTEPRAVVRDGQVVVRRMMKRPVVGSPGRRRRGCGRFRQLQGARRDTGRLATAVVIHLRWASDPMGSRRSRRPPRRTPPPASRSPVAAGSRSTGWRASPPGSSCSRSTPTRPPARPTGPRRISWPIATRPRSSSRRVP
jgi:pyruvate dehydrogenase E2 component (dihydrolipoamide acetyltransferase)